MENSIINIKFKKIMKNLFSILILAAIFMTHGVLAQQHDHSGKDMEQEGQMMMDQSTPLKDIDGEFQKQLTLVFQESLNLNEAFVKSNTNEVIQEANNIDNALQQVNMHLLEGKDHMEWMKDLNDLKKNLEAIKGNTDIALQRKYLAGFSQNLYQRIKTFGINTGDIYYQYCPMALDNQGAYWLSDTQEIHNPYFGEKMLTCGSVKEILEF
jgi:Cu(I)/Ag(I) efflux system membrane fusion protein